MGSTYRRNDAANHYTNEAIKMNTENDNVQAEATDAAAAEDATNTTGTSRWAKWKKPGVKAAKIGGGILVLAGVAGLGYIAVKALKGTGTGAGEAAGAALESVVDPVVDAAVEAVAAFR